MADDRTYVIRSGVDALERLELLAEICSPSTDALLARAGAFSVTSFLDVGCGIGDVASRVARAGVGRAVGVDIDAEVVAGARARDTRLNGSASFAVAGLDDLGTAEWTGFDVVYARCLVSHLPDPVPALRSLLAAARPGGLVLIEDVEVAAVWASPFDPALTRHIELYVRAALGMGARPDVAPEIAVHLRELGATDVDIDLVQPLLRTPEARRIHARTMEAIASPVLQQGLADAAEIDALVTRLDQWAAEPGVVATLPRIVQVMARR